MNLLKKVFGKKEKSFVSVIDEKHCYKQYGHIIYILTKEFGFKYTGIGDNGEECFYKESDTPERIYVHPMFCSYNMSMGNSWDAERKYCFHFKSGFNSQSEQEVAFEKLINHLKQIHGLAAQ